MSRSPLMWLTALWIALLIHVDWHLGRPGHDHLSFGLPYHWLLALVTFVPLPWLLIRRWPDSFWQASVVVIALGVLLGQGLEPLGEVIYLRRRVMCSGLLESSRRSLLMSKAWNLATSVRCAPLTRS